MKFKKLWNWKSNTPIGRIEYLVNWVVITLIQIPFGLPYTLADRYEASGDPFPYAVILLFSSFYFFGVALGLYLIILNVFRRARDIEKNPHVNPWKWAFFGVFPIVSFFGQAYLLFKPGKISHKKKIKTG